MTSPIPIRKPDSRQQIEAARAALRAADEMLFTDWLEAGRQLCPETRDNTELSGATRNAARVISVILEREAGGLARGQT